MLTPSESASGSHEVTAVGDPFLRPAGSVVVLGGRSGAERRSAGHRSVGRDPADVSWSGFYVTVIAVVTGSIR